MQQQITFPSGTVNFYFDRSVNDLKNLYDFSNVIFITNDHIARLYPQYFDGTRTITLPAGEHTKDLETVGRLVKELILLKATRKTVLVGVGGGVITDITGFVASVYMRGIRFGFIPTTLLGMVDAAIGGKNGVNQDFHKNIIGTFSHPTFILIDPTFLSTLPGKEWSNGFAEIIKYAFLFDKELYATLSENYLPFYKEDLAAIKPLIEKCVALKVKIVAEDEKEKHTRKLLNFGHTAGHAIEKLYELPHGYAVGIGMIIACNISEKISGLDHNATVSLIKILEQYYLPTYQKFNVEKVMEILTMDKKRNKDNIDFILLGKEGIGNAFIHPLNFDIIQNTLTEYASYSVSR